MSSPGTPPAEVRIDKALVRELLREQHADFAMLPLERVDSGWDNATFRLGDCYALRLPRRRVAAALIENEQKWLPLLAPRLPLPIPAPLRVGEPGHGYPWRWSVLPWLPGAPADLDEPDADQAQRLAAFLRALHRPAPASAPVNEVRGVPLRRRAPSVEERMERLAGRTGRASAALRDAWQRALSAPRAREGRWLHGDLHARNVLVADGSLSAVIDWGDVTAGDVATDLAAVWMLFSDPAARRAALERYGPSQPELARAIGWAILFGVVLLDSGLVDHPRHAAMGERTLARVAADLA